MSYEKITSAKGTASFFKVNTAVNTFEGKEVGYIASVYFDEKETKRLVADCEARIKEAKTSDEFLNPKTHKPKEWREHPRVPYKTDDDGKIFFRFKTSHVRKDADGNEVRRYVPVFDAKNKPLGHDVAIGNGSIVKISYSPKIYYKNSEINGIKFFLNAIQVLDLVEFGNDSNGKSYGFNEEEGYAAPDNSEDSIEDPFDE